jgi:hypothetical protein
MAKPFFVFPTVDTVFDNSGTLVSEGAQVFVYQAGTTTKITTYPTQADAIAGTNANTNPLIADSAGRIPAIWSTQACKITVAPNTDTDPPEAAYRSRDNINALGQQVTSSSKSSDYTVLTSDRDKIIEVDSSAANRTMTLPAAASAGDGFVVKFKKVDSSTNLVILDGNSSELIDSAAQYVLVSPYDYVELICDGTQWLSSTRIGQIFYREVTVAYTDVQSAASKTLMPSSGSQKYKIRDIRLSGNGTNYGAGGDRNMSITDGTTTWSIIPNATLESLAAGKWGDTAVAYPTSAAAITTASAAGTAIVAKYSGGTTDHTSGSLTLILTLEKVV